MREASLVNNQGTTRFILVWLCLQPLHVAGAGWQSRSSPFSHWNNNIIKFLNKYRKLRALSLSWGHTRVDRFHYKNQLANFNSD
jgi:hypothetical protein